MNKDHSRESQNSCSNRRRLVRAIYSFPSRFPRRYEAPGDKFRKLGPGLRWQASEPQALAETSENSAALLPWLWRGGAGEAPFRIRVDVTLAGA